MLKIYGTMLCKDCVACTEQLTKVGKAYTFLEFSENLLWLKEFLAIRDRDQQFDPVKAEGRIGIPCIVDETGNVSLNWDAWL